MITLNEEKWEDIKHDLLDTIEYELNEEPLIFLTIKTINRKKLAFVKFMNFPKITWISC